VVTAFATNAARDSLAWPCVIRPPTLYILFVAALSIIFPANFAGAPSSNIANLSSSRERSTYDIRNNYAKR
jgi:hypothetical protein